MFFKIEFLIKKLLGKKYSVKLGFAFLKKQKFDFTSQA